MLCVHWVMVVKGIDEVPGGNASPREAGKSNLFALPGVESQCSEDFGMKSIIGFIFSIYRF